MDLKRFLHLPQYGGYIITLLTEIHLCISFWSYSHRVVYSFVSKRQLLIKPKSQVLPTWYKTRQLWADPHLWNIDANFPKNFDLNEYHFVLSYIMILFLPSILCNFYFFVFLLFICVIYQSVNFLYPHNVRMYFSSIWISSFNYYFFSFNKFGLL